MDDPTLAPAAIDYPSQQLPTKKHFGKVPVLDGLRASAIILVLIAHAGLDKLVPGGLGVTIFFFLSGYLITSLLRAELLDTGNISLGKFYLRRALRIFPPLYITLILFLILVLFGLYPNTLKFSAVALQFVHLANYSSLLGIDIAQDHLGNSIEQGIPNMPLWSLAVEEHFYFVFPFLFLLIARKLKGFNQALVLLCICAVVLGVRIITAHTVADYHEIYSWSHTRIDSILFGCILAVWSNPAMDDDEVSYVPVAWHFVVAIGVLFLCLAIRGPVFRQTFRYSIQGLALFVIFSYLIRQKTGLMYSILTSKPMKTIGLLSYTVYLVNYFIFQRLPIVVPHKPHGHWVTFIHEVGSYLLVTSIGLVIIFGYAWLMYIGIERPLARMRARMH